MQPFKKYLFFIVFIITFNVFSQSPKKKLYDSILNLSISKIEKQKKIEGIINASEVVPKLELAQLYYEFSKWNWTHIKDEKKAKEYANKANNILAENPEIDTALFKKNLYNLGIFYSNSTHPDYSNALLYLENLIEVSNTNEVILGKVYKKKGDIYKAMGDFQKALSNYEISERILIRNNNKKQLLNTYISLSATYVDFNDSLYVGDFFKNQRKLMALEKEINIKKNQKIKLLLNEGAIYNTTSNYRKALIPYKEALKLSKEEQDTLLVYGILNNLGVMYHKDKQFDTAEKFINDSEKYINNNVFYESTFYNNKADLYLSRNDFKKALFNYNKAIKCLLLPDTTQLLTYNPSLESIKISSGKKDILDYLIDKANCWIQYHESSKNFLHLKEAEKTIALADQVIDILYFESREEISKLFWRKKASNLYHKGVKVSYLLSKPEKAFYYMEKNKGILLLENINTVKAKKLAKIPDPIIERETVLLEQIKKLQNALTSKKYSSEKKDSIKDHIFAYKFQYEKFIDSLEIEYPHYYKYKKKLPIVSMNDIVEKLSEDELVLEYILDDEDGYVLLLSSEKVILKKMDNISNLNKNIELFKKQIEKPFVNTNDAHLFQETATKLFHHLFPFENKSKLIENKRIQIIPDGKLHYIPFEALTTSNKGNLDASYLLTKTEIYYQYSLSLRIQHTSKKSKQVHSFVGFLPIEYSNKSLSSLTNNYSEINSMLPNFNNEIFTYEKATKEQFLTSYHTNSIVHISTHGGVEDKIPWLAFHDQKLQLDELYFLKNQKELVVLSACKTSVGEHKKGEGLYSITRGFINSGAKSVLSTLWDVNEKSSSEIISQFYEGIVEGKTKSTSLRSAKLSFISSNKNTSLTSPYYWSSIILIGNNSTIDSKIVTEHYLFFGIGVVIVLLFLMLLKRPHVLKLKRYKNRNK